jgi:hypothetical protein
MPHSKKLIRYTIMPDFGSAYAWVNRDGSDLLGGNCADTGGWDGDHAISAGLHAAFADWQRTFERARHECIGIDGNEEIDWPRYHATGLALARRLKAEIGDAARVVYSRPIEDPNPADVQRCEILRDGTCLHWPKIRRHSFPGPGTLPAEIVSGGQTGVDRGALDWAIARDVAHSGWCPKGRRANDGVLPGRYRLAETDSASYEVRTRKNVEIGTTTLVLVEGALTGGSLLTAKVAERLGRRYGLFQMDGPDRADLANGIRGWLAGEDVGRLNIAGPSEERCPGIHQRVVALLGATFDRSDG